MRKRKSRARHFVVVFKMQLVAQHLRGADPAVAEDLVRRPPAAAAPDLYESNIYIPAETRQIKYNAVRARAVIGLRADPDRG